MSSRAIKRRWPCVAALAALLTTPSGCSQCGSRDQPSQILSPDDGAVVEGGIVDVVGSGTPDRVPALVIDGEPAGALSFEWDTTSTRWRAQLELTRGPHRIAVGDRVGEEFRESDAVNFTVGCVTWSEWDREVTGMTATPLAHSSALVAGGYGDVGGDDGVPFLSTILRFDTRTGRLEPFACLRTERNAHAAASLPDGRLIVVGGVHGPGYLASTEIIDGQGVVVPGPEMNRPRASHRLVRLANDDLLAVGGCGDMFSSVPEAERLAQQTLSWSLAGSLRVPRKEHVAVAGTQDQVLVAGGIPCDATGEASGGLDSVEVWDPARADWRSVAPLQTARRNAMAARLGDGRVLIAGGQSHDVILDSTEIYDPATDAWSSGPSLDRPRTAAGIVTFADGRVSVVGGRSVDAAGHAIAEPTTEVWQPDEAAWSYGRDLGTGRVRPAIAELSNDRLLVVGGAAGHPFDMLSFSVLRLP